MKEKDFDRTMLPYDAMGDYSSLFASLEETKEEPSSVESDCHKIAMTET